MRNAITAFSISEEVNLDLKSAWATVGFPDLVEPRKKLKAYGVKLKATKNNPL